jgi:hypothetical protein
VKLLFPPAGAIPLLAFVSPRVSEPPPAVADVAVARFSIETDSSGVLRALADTCLERLIRGLTEKGIAVARHPQLSEKNLHSARPVPWAVLGNLSRKQGRFSPELRLLEVESGDEMRSYFGSDKDPEVIGNLGAAAANRITLFVQERKGTRPAP